METLWSRSLFQEQPPQSWVETTGSFPHPPRWWSNFQTRSGKISLAFRRQWKDVRHNFVFSALCRRHEPHRFSVKNKPSGATVLFLRVHLHRWSLIWLIYWWFYRWCIFLLFLLYAMSLLIFRVHELHKKRVDLKEEKKGPMSAANSPRRLWRRQNRCVVRNGGGNDDICSSQTDLVAKAVVKSQQCVRLAGSCQAVMFFFHFSAEWRVRTPPSQGPPALRLFPVYGTNVTFPPSASYEWFQKL